MRRNTMRLVLGGLLSVSITIGSIQISFVSRELRINDPGGGSGTGGLSAQPWREQGLRINDPGGGSGTGGLS